MQQWEYKVEAAPSVDRPKSLEKRLTKLGAAGWELVALVPSPKEATTIVLKRPATTASGGAPV